MERYREGSNMLLKLMQRNAAKMDDKLANPLADRDPWCGTFNIPMEKEGSGDYPLKEWAVPITLPHAVPSAQYIPGLGVATALATALAMNLFTNYTSPFDDSNTPRPGHGVEDRWRPFTASNCCGMLTLCADEHGGVFPSAWFIGKECADELISSFTKWNAFGDGGPLSMDHFERGELKIIGVPILPAYITKSTLGKAVAARAEPFIARNTAMPGVTEADIVAGYNIAMEVDGPTAAAMRQAPLIRGGYYDPLDSERCQTSLIWWPDELAPPFFEGEIGHRSVRSSITDAAVFEGPHAATAYDFMLNNPCSESLLRVALKTALATVAAKDARIAALKSELARRPPAFVDPEPESAHNPFRDFNHDPRRMGP